MILRACAEVRLILRAYADVLRLQRPRGSMPGTDRAPPGDMDRLELERRSLALAAGVFRFCGGFRSTPGGRGPADQLVDSATSVGANDRATSRARSRAEFVSKLGIVVEEAYETVYGLEFIGRVGLGDEAAVDQLLTEARELRAIFAASYATERRNAGLRRVR